MPNQLVVCELPNSVTDSDKKLIDGLTLSEYYSMSFYDKDGCSFKKSDVQGDDDEIKQLNNSRLVIVDLPWDVSSVEIDGKKVSIDEIPHDLIYFKSKQPLKGMYVKDVDTDEVSSIIVSLDEFSIVPRGQLFDKYKSELTVNPILVDGRFNFGSDDIRNHFDDMEGITPENQDEHDVEQYLNQYLIYHPVSGTSVSYDAKTKSYCVVHLNITFLCDSLDLALMLAFDWAVSECGYQI